MHHGERLNCVSHVAGGFVALVGVALLYAAALRSGNPAGLLGSTIYGITIVSMFAISTAYHSAQGARRAWWRKLDHIAIFVLIAGTYTPFCLLPLRDGVGPWLLVAQWALALLGAVLEFKLSHRTRLPSFFLYFAMAFLSLAAFPGLSAALPAEGMSLIRAGFWIYGLGFGFYVLDKKFRGKHLHGIWHFFVIAGAFCHFACVYFYVIGA